MKLHDITPAIPENVLIAANWFGAHYGDLYTITWNQQTDALTYKAPGIRPMPIEPYYIRSYTEELEQAKRRGTDRTGFTHPLNTMARVVIV